MTVVDVITSVMLAGFSASLLFVAYNSDRFQRYGREALVCAGLFIAFLLVTRWLVLLDAISLATARTLNGAAAAVATAILAQLAYLHHRETRSHHHHDRSVL